MIGWRRFSTSLKHSLGIKVAIATAMPWVLAQSEVKFICNLFSFQNPDMKLSFFIFSFCFFILPFVSMVERPVILRLSGPLTLNHLLSYLLFGFVGSDSYFISSKWCMHPVTVWQLIRVVFYTQEYSTFQIYVIPQRGNHLLTVSLPVQRSFQNFDKKDLEKTSNWKLQIYKSTFSSIWLARFLLFLKFFWRSKAEGWGQVENSFRRWGGEMRRPQTSGWAATGLRWQHSHPSYFLRLRTLWGSLSCQYHSVCRYSMSDESITYIDCRKRFIVFIPYPLARRGGGNFLFIYLFIFCNSSTDIKK